MSGWVRKVHVWMDVTIAPEAGVSVARRLSDADTICVGVYVEDTALRCFASLPGARYVSRFSLNAENAASDTLAGELSVRHSDLLMRFRRSLGLADDDAAPVVNVPRQQLGGAVGAEELLIVARPDAATWVGTRFVDLLERVPGDVLFVNQPWDTGTSVAVLADPGETGARAIATGRELARREGLRTVLLVPPQVEAQGADDFDVHPCGCDSRALLEACRALDARVLVVPAGAPLDWGEVGHSMLELLDCSLLVVHGSVQ